MTTDRSVPAAAAPVLHWCRHTPRAIAVVENDLSFTYAMLARSIAQAAKLLARAGVGEGSLVGIECDARLLHLVLILACETVGAAHVALLPRELGLAHGPVANCRLVCAVSDGVAGPRFMRLSADFARELSGMAVEEADLARLERMVPADGIARIGRTSGTSGESKFVAYTREPLSALFAIIPHLTRFDQARQNFIALYSFLNIGTYTRCLAALRYGATVVFGAGNELASDIQRLPGCHTFLLVRDAAALVASEPFAGGRLDRCSLRVHGGFLPPTLLGALRERVTTDVVSLYSMNETSVIMTSDGQGPGRVLPGVSIRIVDALGKDQPPGEPGRIMVRTPWMSAGYPWDAEETRARFLDGWFLTGDLGVTPRGGGLLVLGRADEMINLGGIKFAPHPIEQRIRAVDGVVDAVLIGVDNAAGTGELHVFVERNDPAIDDGLEAAIAPLLSESAAVFTVHCVNELPRTGTGKVQRGVLRRGLGGQAMGRPGG
jgi:acyl-coenzyme A synthetase/AMP-(fatty) acid ligase